MFLLFTIAFAACGGGGGGDDGGGGGGGGPTPLATGTFTKIFGPTDDGNNSYPFHGTFDQKVQLLYTAAEINGSGNIIALRFRRSSVSAQETCPNTTIRLGHTSLTALTATFGSNVEEGRGSQVTVLNDTTVTIPAGAAGTWFEIPLGTAFNYNGVDNLVVEVERTTACSASVSTDVSNAANRRAQSSATDITPGVAEHNQTTASTVDTAQNWMQFTFAGGDDLANYGAPSSYGAPFTTTVAWRHVQVLHLASDINGSGPITGIGMVVNNLTTAATYTVTIKLGHSTLTNLGITYASNFSGSPVTVASGLTFTVPANVPVGSTLWLPVTGSFTYNGTDNLIVDVDVTAASADTDWAYTSVANRSLYGASGAATGTVDIGAFHTKFRFNGGTMDFITAGSSSLSPPFDIGILRKTHWLYDAASLGTGGSISKIAFRLANNSVVSDYSNFTVTIGQTSNNQLNGALFASDFDTSANVLSTSTFSIAAGMLAGDWIEIPLSGAFSYDPTKNLVVEITTLSATAANYVRGEVDATRFPNHITAATAPGATVPTVVGAYGVDMRFWVQK